MSEASKPQHTLPPEQQAIRDKCFHPTGRFIQFKKQEIEQSIPKRFEEIARAYPYRLAIETKTQSLTYEALNQMANRVARAIIALQGTGNEPIALLLDQGVSLIAAILGGLKSGKIYVSLEPFQASARNRYILDETETRLIVTNNRSFSEAKTLARIGCHILNIDELDTSLSAENMGCSLPPDALASIMYTSGSTGPPKGVVQNHRNVLHSCKSYTNGFQISMEDRLSLLHSCSFNGSAYNLFGALLNGAALFPLDVRKQGVHRLVNWLGQNEITIYHSSPTTFRNALQDLPAGERNPNLRIIHLSGAAVSNVDVELYRSYCSPNCILVHRMGVTETGTIRWYFIEKTTPMGVTRVPIGYPADHKEALILDDCGEKISDNRAGEIAIKSRYLSLGYWRNPRLTQTRFLPDPNGGDRRIYLTGDLGRMAPDGCLVHLGRNDYRVKVRGFSVGVGEIESALLEHRGIHEAVVVGWESPFGDKRLVAYLVQDDLRVVTVTELRAFLQDRLPDYMIPSTFVTLSELPLTPNGKVDRTALPAPGDERPNLATPFAEPTTPIEKELARIWAGILSLDQVGIDDNFFDLGGHSLAASQVISRVIQTFQLELPVKALFDAPTVADMALIITQNHANRASEAELARLLSEVEAMNDVEAQRQLAPIDGK